MGWKNLSYWLKGGIITLVLVYCIDFIGYLIKKSIIYSHPYIFGVFFHILNSPIWIFVSAISVKLYWLMYNANMAPTPTIFGFIIISIFYFVVGALIGLIVGKIKSRKD
ncbi:MAG: hypothetical protein Q8N63_01635 [Nanoarchaeota archaeon]|nr:hypothetical protein [Nanoarchaeota archaeon]